MQYLASLYADRFTHPILAAILTVAAVLYLIGGVVELTAPFVIPVITREVPPIAAGFFGVFATLAAAIGVFAYGVLYAARLVSVFRDRTAPTSS